MANGIFQRVRCAWTLQAVKACGASAVWTAVEQLEALHGTLDTAAAVAAGALARTEAALVAAEEAHVAAQQKQAAGWIAHRQQEEALRQVCYRLPVSALHYPSQLSDSIHSGIPGHASYWGDTGGWRT